MEEFTEIPLRDAVTSLRLDEHFRGRTTLDQFATAADHIASVEADPERRRRIEDGNPRWRETMKELYPGNYVVRHYGNHAVVAGDIDMDRLPGSEVAGIVVDGDLELNGAILNWEIDTTAAFLLVRGSLHCTNIIFGSMDLVVQGHVTAGNLIVATYNHGHLLIEGNVHAKYVIIDDDGASEIRGRIHAGGWNASPNAKVNMRRSEWIKEVRPEFRAEFFDRAGDPKCDNGNVDLVKALLAGRNILRPRL